MVEIVVDITLRKQADFGIGLSGREQMTNPLQRGKLLKAVATLACASLTAIRCGQHQKYRAGHDGSDRIL
ncbi:MAG: hypothetical protein LC776_03840, partial [Acidobacteria bacterium]|nr:hypothetical protein [Acidobacteriota bacterium]